MNRKELAVTILGLAGTFLMPWPGQADRHGDPSQRHGVLEAFACTRDCGEVVAMGSNEASSQVRAPDPKRLASWRASR